MNLKWWWPYAAGAGVGLVGALVAIALIGKGDASPNTEGSLSPGNEPAPTISASQEPVEPEPTPEAPVEGAIPVPAFPASAIPWDEVGDGWFLLTYDPDSSNDVWPDAGEPGIARYPQLDEAVMLTSPMGDLYYVRSLVGMGNGSPVQWTGDALTILDGEFYQDSDDVPHGPLTSLSLATGAARIVNQFAYYPYYLRTLSNGNIVTQWGWEDSLSVDVLAPDLTVTTEICHEPGIATSLSPDGARVVCLENDYPTSRVMLYGLSGGAGEPIDEFQYEPWFYSTYGWWDADSFVLVRWTDDGGQLRWTYNVTTRKLAELVPTLSDGTPATTFQGVGGYRLVATDSVVEIQGFDGSLLAKLPCFPAAISGNVAISSCMRDTGRMDIVVANLDTGTLTTVASFDATDFTDVRVFPPPGGEKTGRT